MRILVNTLTIILGCIALPFGVVGITCVWISERITIPIDFLNNWYHSRPKKTQPSAKPSLQQFDEPGTRNQPTFIPMSYKRRKR